MSGPPSTVWGNGSGEGTPPPLPPPTQSTVSSNSLHRSASALAGFRGTTEEAVSREALIEEGVPASQADARIVRLHQDQMLMQHFRCWILCFSFILLLSIPAMLGIMIWMLVEYLHSREVECDVPLQTWVYVVIIIDVLNSTINRPSPTGSCVQHVLCQWRRDPENPQPMPLRVRLLNIAITLFNFSWYCLGIHWVMVDGSKSEGSPPACHDVVPGLYNSVKFYASFKIALAFFMYAHMIGFARLLRLAVRRGLLHTSDAAPKGAIEKNTELVLQGDPDFQEQPSCSICLEDFSMPGRPVARTKGCRHIFHKQCLQGWLQVNRTCPLCRKDLGTLT